MKKIKELIAFLLCLTIVISMTTMLNISALAATSWVGSSSYGWYANDDNSLSTVKSVMSSQTSSYMMQRFEKILSEFPLSGYFNSYKTRGCLWHCGECGTASSSCIRSFYDDETNQTVALNSTQCYGYAKYCFYRFFKTFSSKTIALSSGFSTTTLKNTITTDMIGSHFRSRGHSLVFLAKDTNYLYFIDANSGYNSATGCASGKCSNSAKHYSTECKINLRRYSYSEFVSRYSAYGVTIYAPTSVPDIDNSLDSTVTVQNFADNYENDYYDTNAILHGQVHKPKSYPLTEFGIRIKKASGSYSDADAKFYKHNSNPAFNNYIDEPYARCWFDINAELNTTLTHDTSYTYQIYAKVNGTEYFSEERTFSTTGSHSFGNWGFDNAHHWHNCSGCGYVKDAGAHVFSNACDTNCNTCGYTRTISHKYDNDCDENCNVCGNLRDTNHPIKITVTKTTHIIECANGCDLYFENEHEYDNDSDNDCNICGGMRVIEHKYDNNADTICNVCGAVAYPGGNTLVKEGNTWYHILNRQKVADTTLVQYNGTWYYVKDGKVDFSATTLVKYNNKWWYVKNGKMARDNTLVKYGNVWYHVNGGNITSSTTLVQYNGVWYYVKNGKVDFSATTLVKYNNKWWYVKAGKMARDNTLVKYGNVWYHVNGGNITTSTTLVQYNGTWYYVKNGQVDFKSNTLVKYYNVWYHVNGGKWVKDTTLVKYNNKWYYVSGGRVNFIYTGRVLYSGKYYNVKNGVKV